MDSSASIDPDWARMVAPFISRGYIRRAILSSTDKDARMSEITGPTVPPPAPTPEPYVGVTSESTGRTKYTPTVDYLSSPDHKSLELSTLHLYIANKALPFIWRMVVYPILTAMAIAGVAKFIEIMEELGLFNAPTVIS